VAKLTLSVDPKVVQQAKRYARARRTSVSRLVEEYLQILGHGDLEAAEPPVLRELRGLLRHGSTSDYRHHVIHKYQ
jgi:uncharacterized protein DUF6364